MKKTIVTTSINPPTDAIKKFDSLEDWGLLVVGDKKTPADYKLKRGLFLPWTYLEATYPDLARCIGWNSVRLGRMVGFIEAYRRGADIIAVVDDDIVPFDDWGKDVVLGEEITAVEWGTPSDICFDPFRPYSFTKLPARGFPLEINEMSEQYWIENQEAKITPLVRVDVCTVDSDYHAIDRLTGALDYFEMMAGHKLYFSKCFSPINTQNTFIHRSVIKDFWANIPFIGRADDIWAGYFFQAMHPNQTVYGAPSAQHAQNRSVQSLVNDLEEEIFLYRNTLNFLETLKYAGIDEAINKFLPMESIEAIETYRRYFE